MRATEFIKPIFEAQKGAQAGATFTEPGYFTVGDSHSNGVGNYGRGKTWKALGKDGASAFDSMHMSAIDSIPKGSVVAISLGANDLGSKPVPQIVSQVQSVISSAKSKGLEVVYLLPTATTKPESKEKREELRTALKNSIAVPTYDLGTVTGGDGIHQSMGAYGSIGNRIASAHTPAAGAESGKDDAKKDGKTSKVVDKLKQKLGFGDAQTDSKDNFVQVPTGAKMGSRGVEVVNLQRGLIALGYDVGSTKDDGIIGKYTSAAISKFQTDNKLAPSGIATPETVEKVNEILRASPEKLNKLERAKPEEFKGKITTSALGDKASRELLTKEAQSQGLKDKELAAFLAQCSTESGGFRYMSEIWGPTAAQTRYEGRRDLGNTQPGDGYRYRGRGYIQLTGRSNYREASKALGLPLEEKPELVEKPDIAATTAVYFWKTNVQPRISNFDDTKAITRIINGGYNGLDDRMMRFAAFKQDMNIA
jgi:putative chitinase